MSHLNHCNLHATTVYRPGPGWMSKLFEFEIAGMRKNRFFVDFLTHTQWPLNSQHILVGRRM